MIGVNVKIQISFFCSTFILIFFSSLLARVLGLCLGLCLGLFLTMRWAGEAFFSGVSPYRNLYLSFYFSSFFFSAELRLGTV